MKTYFEQQATALLEHVAQGTITEADIAAILQCIYTAGVIDSSLYSEPQRGQMYDSLKTIYKLESEN